MITTKFTKQYFLWLVCLVLMLGQVSCRRDEAQPEPQPSAERTGGEKLLVSTTSHPGTREIEYNPDKTPKRFIIGTDTVEIKYASGTITFESRRKGDDGKRVFTLENGVVKSSKGYLIDEDGNERESLTMTYIYENGKLVKEVGTQNGKIMGYATYSYDATYENIVSMESQENGMLLFRQTYEYTDIPARSDRFNELGPRVDNMFFPKKSKYLVKRSINEDFLNKAKMERTFFYDLDEDGYVISGKIVYDEGHESKWTNTWE